jgi:hypothetical protein
MQVYFIYLILYISEQLIETEWFCFIKELRRNKEDFVFNFRKDLLQLLINYSCS